MNNDWRGNFPREDSLLRNDCSGSRIENELPSSWAAAEVKHVVQRARNRIRRAVSDPAEVPIVFDEPQNRGLICYGIVDEVLFCPGRNHQQRQPRAKAAAAILCSAADVTCLWRATIAGAEQLVV